MIGKNGLTSIVVSLWLAVNGVAQSTARVRVPTTKQVPGKPLSAREIVTRVLPSLVLVLTQDKDGNALAQASGFFYKPGLVATNLHALKRASRCYIKLLGKSESYQVQEVFGIDIQHDLCVLKVAASASPLPLAVNRQDTVRAGDEVYVVGNPVGLEGSISKGIISAVRQELGLIQIDASISPGSSGGPVVNTNGHVVAVATSSIVNGQNINFAVNASNLQSLLKWHMPVDVAAALAVSDRENDRLYGKVRSVRTTLSEKIYDDMGDLLESTTFLEGRQLLRVNYEYDRNRLATRRWLTHWKDKPVEEKLTLQEGLNARLNRIKFSTTDEIRSPLGELFSSSTYDRDGNLVESVLKTTVGLRTSITRFDKRGWEVQEEAFISGRRDGVTRYSYELDEHGNWIKQFATIHTSGDPDTSFFPTSTIYRQITYYRD